MQQPETMAVATWGAVNHVYRTFPSVLYDLVRNLLEFEPAK
jgi:hypothetical protein